MLGDYHRILQFFLGRFGFCTLCGVFQLRGVINITNMYGLKY